MILFPFASTSTTNFFLLRPSSFRAVFKDTVKYRIWKHTWTQTICYFYIVWNIRILLYIILGWVVVLSTFFLRHTTLIIGFVTLHFEIVCLKLVSGLSNDICIINNVPRLCNRVEYIIYYPFSFFFSPNPPIKWIQMNFSHKPNAVLLSLKDTKIYTCCVGIVLTDVMRWAYIRMNHFISFMRELYESSRCKMLTLTAI